MLTQFDLEAINVTICTSLRFMTTSAKSFPTIRQAFTFVVDLNDKNQSYMSFFLFIEFLLKQNQKMFGITSQAHIWGLVFLNICVRFPNCT